MRLRSKQDAKDRDMLTDAFLKTPREDKGAVMIPVVSFIGRSNSGKTTLLEKVARELKIRGYRVAIVKHTHHDFEIDRPGKDTWRLAQAGGDIVVLSSPDKITLVEYPDAELTLDEVSALFKTKVDIVLTEGYKNGNAPKILVLSAIQGQEQLCHEEEILATVSAHLCSSGAPQFDDDDVASITNLLIEQIGRTLPREVGDVTKVADLVLECGEAQIGEFEELLAQSVALHGHICPGQVLGIRMAMRGLQELGLEKPNEGDKRLVVYVEIDRCATDAIQVVTGCKLGKRTMKYVDYGKLAATFVDLHTGDAVRLAAREDAREKATLWYRPGWTRHEVEVAAYKAMLDEELFYIEHVLVQIPVEDMPGPPLRRVICDECGEGINDCREVTKAGRVLCRSCVYGRYYQHLGTSRPVEQQCGEEK